MKTSTCFGTEPFTPCLSCGHARWLLDYDDDAYITCAPPAERRPFLHDQWSVVEAVGGRFQEAIFSWFVDGGDGAAVQPERRVAGAGQFWAAKSCFAGRFFVNTTVVDRGDTVGVYQYTTAESGPDYELRRRVRPATEDEIKQLATRVPVDPALANCRCRDCHETHSWPGVGLTSGD